VNNQSNSLSNCLDGVCASGLASTRPSEINNLAACEIWRRRQNGLRRAKPVIMTSPYIGLSALYILATAGAASGSDGRRVKQRRSRELGTWR
jgi:hypothetical protein